MPLRIPFKPSTFDIEQAAKKNSWRGFANALRRNFEEIEMVVASNDNALEALDTRLDTAEATLTYLGNKQVFSQAPTATRSTSSTSYVDWPNGEVLSGTFEKKGASTRLVVQVICGFYVSTPGAVVEFAVSIGGNDYAIRKTAVNGANEHEEVSGAVEIPALGAGNHTVTLRAKVSGATLSSDVNDQVYIVVEEVPA